MGEVEETVELRAVRLTLVLSPVPQEVVDGAESRVSLIRESLLVDPERAEVRRYTDAAQSLQRRARGLRRSREELAAD
ncbi:hypothetical protein [Crenalkalicoccus roseus]|uniref:hypothetical protein n=1 Tax=Crenalkalicoccus roseus TaxID=1485588 RepID=UPI001F02A040|nr:hypothetical protein [Crenalkalicoccus roseus]